MKDESSDNAHNDPDSPVISSVALDGASIADPGVSMPNRPKEPLADHYGKFKHGGYQPAAGSQRSTNIPGKIMFSKIGTLFTTISGLITGNYQSTLAAIIQFVLPAANLPANIENAISTVILAVVFAVMHKQNVVTAFLAAGASIILILQWAANFFPSISPFHAPLVMISAAFMALMQDKTAHSATGAPVS